MPIDIEGDSIEDKLKNRAELALKIFETSQWAADCKKEASLDNELNIVIMGPSGSGKSTTVNNLLEGM